MTIVDATGNPGATTDGEDASNAAVAAINAAGGIKGSPLTLDVCDTKSDPNTAAACARKAVSDGDVAVVGSVGQFETSYLPVLETAGIPAVGEIPTSPAAFTSKVVFPLSSGTTALFAGQGKMLADQGATKVALITTDSAVADQFAPIINLGLKGKNLTVVRTVKVPAGAPDLSSYVAAVTDGNVDGIVAILFGPDAIKFVQAAKAAGVTAKIAIQTQTPELLIKTLGADAEGLLMVSDAKLTSQSSDPAVKAYLDGMKAINKAPTNWGLFTGWSPVQLFALAARQVATVDSKSIIDALNTMTSVDVGTYPPVDFTKPIVALGQPRLFNDQVLLAVVRNGVEVPLTGDFVHIFA
jgi:ABC-type branched-subunit amino acid transport system substrate-binding protein